jgi:hypothetical protein
MNYVISEERFRNLILRLVKSMQIEGLYRVQINFPEKKKGDIVVALFFETVSDSKFYKKVHDDVFNTIENYLGLHPLVITIPYSEAKYHLNEPKNI